MTPTKGAFMNERERAELERLKQRLESLRREFDLLWMQAQQLEERLNVSQKSAAATSLKARPLEMTRLTAPSLEVSGDPSATLRVEQPTVPATPSGSQQPPPLPPVIAPQPAPRYASKGVEGQLDSALSATEGATTTSP